MVVKYSTDNSNAHIPVIADDLGKSLKRSNICFHSYINLFDLKPGVMATQPDVTCTDHIHTCCHSNILHNDLEIHTQQHNFMKDIN